MNMNFKNKLNINIVIVIFSFILLNGILIFKIIYNENCKQDIVRLHVIANSNSVSDQIIKLKVEAKIQDYLNNLEVPENTTKDEYINLLKCNNQNILNISNNLLKDNNLNYSSKLEIGKIKYDKKESATQNMEAGTYDSMKLVLGDGNGKNIWSIIFPNEKNISSVKELETILPGISDIYNESIEEENNINVCNNKTEAKECKSLIVKVIKVLQKKS